MIQLSQQTFQALAPFNQLPVAAIQLLLQTAQPLKYRVGQPLLRREVLSQQVIVLLEGQARLLGYDPRTQQPITLDRFGRGDMLGVISLIRGVPCETVIASTEVLALTLSSYTFLNLLNQYPEFGRAVRDHVYAIEAFDLVGEHAKANDLNLGNLRAKAQILCTEASLATLPSGLCTLDHLDRGLVWVLSGGTVLNVSVGSAISLDQPVEVLSPQGARLLGMTPAVLANTLPEPAASESEEIVLPEHALKPLKAFLDFPFLDLFQRLQQAGMQLSPEQYDLLRQALTQGFGLANWDGDNWDDLRQVCRVLWVKPSRNYDGQVFDQVFNHYVTEKRREIQALQRPEIPSQPLPSQPLAPTRQWPKVPPRKMPASTPAPAAAQTPVAVKTGLAGLPEVDASGLSLTPSQMPLPQRAILDSWQLLRRPLRESIRNELDLEATIRRICQAGYFSDVVMRPAKSKRVELVVLVDDSNVMLPFAPALQPLVKAIETQQITPATLYRFTTYPDDYLYDWQQPTQAISLNQVLSRMHARRTIVVVWGEAGATQTNSRDEHRQGLMTFLTRLSPCVRSLLWLNPLPPHRWPGTLAAEVAYWLDGRMTHLSVPQVLALAKLPATDDRLFLRTVV